MKQRPNRSNPQKYRLNSVDPLDRHSRSWRDMNGDRLLTPQELRETWLDCLGFVLLILVILFVLLFLGPMLDS